MSCDVDKATEGLENECDVGEVTERLENELFKPRSAKGLLQFTETVETHGAEQECW